MCNSGRFIDAEIIDFGQAAKNYCGTAGAHTTTRELACYLFVTQDPSLTPLLPEESPGRIAAVQAHLQRCEECGHTYAAYLHTADMLEY